MTSKTETILQALATLVEGAVNTKFERNASVPEKIPADGLIILRDGNPGLPDEALGGFAARRFVPTLRCRQPLKNRSCADP